jgi:hypothetical protein
MLEELMKSGGQEAMARRSQRRAFREAQEIIAGERQLLDCKYVWHWVLCVAGGVGLFMFAVGWVMNSLWG